MFIVYLTILSEAGWNYAIINKVGCLFEESIRGIIWH